jgi:carboxypeptidase family protein
VTARWTSAPAAGLALVLAIAGLSGCHRMVIGRLEGDAGADASFDARVDALVETKGDVVPGLPPDANAGDVAPGSDGATASDGAGAKDGTVARDAAAGADGGDAAADGTPADASSGDTSSATDAAPDAGPPPIGVLAGRITMSDLTNFTSRGSGVAGVLVTLTGPSARTAISDANGSFQFPTIAPGTYTVAVSKAGATLTPASSTGVAVAAGSAGTVVNFDCAPPCGTGPTIDPARELFIEDQSVLTDARASNASDGAWSFRSLIEQMATTTPNNYVNDFINNIVASGRDMTRLRQQWPTVLENSVMLPDVSRAPFELLAIVNGIDAHAAGQGELRFVYGIYDVPGAPTFNPQGRTFTLMLTYALPATAAYPTRQAWAARFHALGAIPFGPDYNAALQAITDSVVRTGTLLSSAENPKGSTLVALSINEAFGNPTPYQLRQLRPMPDPVHGQRELIVGTVDQTPDSSLNLMNGPLSEFLNANAALVQGGFAVLPPALLGTQSSAFAIPVLWNFPGVTNEALRHAFAGQTCSGCHSSEAPAGPLTIFHVIPYNGPTSASTSGWVTIVDIPRRVSFLQNQLTCSGVTCAPGAEPMMGPTR